MQKTNKTYANTTCVYYTNMNTDIERYRKLSAIAQIGWWEADFSAGHYICSDYLCDIFELENEILPFERFREFIREDYRQRIVEEFNTNIHHEFYEGTFPIYSKYGEMWMHTRLVNRTEIPGRGTVSFGVMQRVEDPHKESHQISEQINQQINRQNSISRSLLSFLKDEKIDLRINEILQDILMLFNGGRVYIFEYAEDFSFYNCTYEAVAKDVTPEKETLQKLATTALPWWSKQIQAGKPIVLDSLSQLPAEARNEYEILSRQNIKSLMVVPLIANEQTWGYLGIDLVNNYRNWNNEDYQWLSSLANIISICIELRKAKDDAIRERSFLQNLFRYLPLGYIRLTIIRDANGKPCDFHIADANQISSTLAGLAPEFYVNKLASELYEDPSSKLDWIKDILEENIHKETDIFFERTNKNCHCIVYSPEVNEIVALFIDTTETVRIHEALDQSEKLFRNIFANIPAGVEIYDKSGNLVDINNKDMETFGLTRKADVIGLNIFSNPNIPDEIKERIEKEDLVDFRLVYRFNKTQGYFHSQKKKDIELYTKISKLYNSQGKFNGYVLINMDNTERMDALNRIRDFENFFLLISDFAKVGYAKLNLINRRGYAIKQWYKNMGENENTPLPRVVGLYNKIHPDDRKSVLDFYEKVKAGTSKNFKGEVRVLKPNSKDQWNWVRMNVVVTKYEPEQGEIEIIGINYDITELKETEAMLIEAKEKAETMDRLKSAFLANMSHEIRTPLNAIVGFSGLLVDTEEIEERRQYIKIVEENNDLLLHLISDILDLSKIEAGTFEFTHGDVNVNRLCEDIVTSMQMKVPEGVELTFDRHLPDCHIISDRNRIYQVISNFVNNALKFTAEGSIKVGYIKEKDFLKFYVSDTGIGIAEEQRKHVFERFVKLNNFIHGTGLGLSICKSIVEQLGGTIGVNSELGKGSEFWFTHPYTSLENTDQEISVSTSDRLGEAKVKRQKPLLLVAEDTDSNYLLISTILKKEYILERALNGKQAVEKFHELKPDLILMDLRMPEMNGLEATAKIRETDAHIPVLAVTAFAFESDRIKAIEAGCNDLITKPIHPTTLKEKIKQYL